MTKRWMLGAPALLIAVLLQCAVARAQVAVLRIDPQAEEVCRDVEAALKGTGVVSDPGYLSQAREQDLDPTSDASLEMITPLLAIKLAVVPLSVEGNSIQLEYRDGTSGERLGSAAIPLERGKLGAAGRAQLKREVVRHLGTVLSGTDSEASSTEEAAGGVDDESGTYESEPEQRSPALRVRVHAGVGLGMREVEWTADGRGERVELGAFPAFDLGLSFSFRLSDAVALAPRVDYQSSLAYHEVEEARVAAPADRVGVRVHRFAIMLALPILWSGEGSVSVAPALGLGIRNLRPEVHHLSTPAYSLLGPVVQLALGIPLGDTVTLRIAPEAQWLSVGSGLRERSVEDSGLSVGGELTLGVGVVTGLSLELSYREAHALLSSPDGQAGDVERFVTLRAAATL